MGSVVGVVLSVHLAEEFWAMVPERRIVPVPTHGLATVYTGASRDRLHRSLTVVRTTR